jgi:hypothetical protein
MVTVHTITYNEEIMVEFFVNHYRKNFPNCIIKIYDNYSTDNTVEIAKKLGCDIIYYNSNDKLSDSKYLEIKNNCWKTSDTDWVIVCDCDELIDIDEEELITNQQNGITLFKFMGYDIVNYDKNINLDRMEYGNRNKTYDKTLLFKKTVIQEINYDPGCHTCSPIGINVYSELRYKLLHYKYIDIDYTISRYKLFFNRLSDENHKFQWSYHYNTTEKEIQDFYISLESKLEKIK